MKTSRITRLLLLAAMIVIAAVVGVTYYTQKASLARRAPQRPTLLPVDTSAAAKGWVWSKDVNDRTKVEVRAQSFRQTNGRMELEGVDLKLFADDGKTYDLVKSAKAAFDQQQGTLYSEGEVEITMRVPAPGSSKPLPNSRLLSIKSSGVTFESETGRARTDRAASFAFAEGDGKCVGASYDPKLRELIMRSAVELNWRGRAPGKAMKVEAGELFYKEKDSQVLLRTWSRVTRGEAVLNAADSYVTLNKGAIEKVEALKASGSEVSPERTLEYAAGHLWMEFAPEGQIRKLTGTEDTRLVSLDKNARTTVTGDRIEMEFEPGKDESALKQAMAFGKSTLESVPVPQKGKPAPETRRLRSEVVALVMKPGGREVDRLETHAPGTLDFIPNSPGQRRRTLEGERMRLDYGPNNTPRQFAAYKAVTRTEPEKKTEAPLRTWSNDMKAEFDDRGEISQLEQWTDFRYEEGDRRGSADRATLDQKAGIITLDRRARFQDPTGTLSADRIVLAQATGDVDAEGNVVSTKLPDKKGTSSAMLANDEMMQARAPKMTTAQKNQRIRYSGGATLWQGPNRLRAETIDIDRAARVLAASGGVRTQFVDEQKKGAKTAPGFVTVESAALVYRESERLAHYTGGAHMTRPGMDVRAREIRAFLNDRDADSSLDKALADGAVEFVRSQPGRTLKGRGEHAEYYAAEQRLVLIGGQPVLEDSLRGNTRGRELIYYAKDDRLIVHGEEKAPVVSNIRRR